MSRRILRILGVFVFLCSASGQQPATNAQTPAESKAQQELNKKAEALLTEIAQYARGLKNKENQIMARVAVADLLWKGHEADARVLYKEALADLRQSPGADGTDPEENDGDRDLSNLREQLLRSLSRHDPMMARDLLRETQLSLSSDSAKSDTSAASDAQSPDLRLELSLMTEMAAKDPKEAVRIARAALSEGYPDELVTLLSKLAEKEPKAAQELALEIITKLRKEDLSNNLEAVNLAFSLLHEVLFAAKPDPDEAQPQKQTPLMDSQTSRDFIGFLTAAVMKKQPGPGTMSLLMTMRSMIEEVEQLAPDQAVLLKQKFAEMDKAGDEVANPYRRVQQLSETGDTKHLLELAATAPREARDGVYAEAASSAWRQGDKTQANEIIAKISSPFERSRLLTNFQEQAIRDLVEKEEFVQARQMIAEMRSTERRLSHLVDLATVVAAKGDRKTALEILQEANSFVPGKAKYEYELEAKIRIAGVLASLDTERSFAIIGSAIDQINELMAATALIANFSPFMPGTTIKDDEFTIDSPSSIPFGFSMLSSKDLRTLVQADFTRTRVMFDKFQRPETRIAAYLLMSRSVLEPESENDCTCQERLRKLKSKAANKAAPQD